MKYSGYKWFGYIPYDWEITKAKYIAEIFIPQRIKPVLNSEGDGYPWITLDSLSLDKFRQKDLWVSILEAKKANSRIIKRGSVVASCAGKFAISSIVKVDSIINQQLQGYIPSNYIDQNYLSELIRLSSDYFNLVSTMSTIPYVNQFGFANLPILLPPKNEQLSIVQELNIILLDLERKESLLLSSISLLEERLKALVFSAVTGQINVLETFNKGLK